MLKTALVKYDHKLANFTCMYMNTLILIRHAKQRSIPKFITIQIGTPMASGSPIHSKYCPRSLKK